MIVNALNAEIAQVAIITKFIGKMRDFFSKIHNMRLYY
ncbi:hypothetical protein N473_13155 [Pseudoalteromonas luteoviolacea CPMOR-1]|uniref:Uncharacterized protein n=1 Tax=Pseudoalteromonas luteoviolacea CPMOR-1 TaxID=1365248 RepID=A0A167LKM2_9GAMM|nr:hypothetical protein N473_13155 [Pseudoalteromonas luteoviolacea CPMOR-1]